MLLSTANADSKEKSTELAVASMDTFAVMDPMSQ